MFLKSVYFPGFDYFTKETCIHNYYPAKILAKLDIKEMEFSDITIFYGNNGSGKSTLLNLLAEKIKASRQTRFFKDEEWVVGPGGGSLHKLFDECVKEVDVTLELGENGKAIELPFHRKVITSDDIFKILDSKKEFNQNIVLKTDEANKEGKKLLKEGYYYRGMEDFERLRDYNTMRSSPKRYIASKVGTKKTQYSNGETAIKYYMDMIENDGIYLLDEPENCLSPLYQLQLRDLILSSSRYCNCQFIIATHSPFFLSLDGARVYNLDKEPVVSEKWYQLENSIIWYNFFKEYQNVFETKEEGPLTLPVLTNKEFDELMDTLKNMNCTSGFIGMIRGNEEYLSKVFYLLNKYPDLEEMDLRRELGLIR
ncbi:MAG: ATP-binding cassette domain-containing protein [Anaeroplasmataceae bacterium]|nr:ATP-binding cassette domain-containing protein [Anaeroplasmataceae bacterium]